MLPDNLQWIVKQFEPEGDAWLLFEIACDLEKQGNFEGAATVYDRAFGLEPSADEIREARGKLLDRLAVVEHDLLFRYIPGGSFLMGCENGEADEKPWHPVWLSPYWMSETPISWSTYCRLRGWGSVLEGGYQQMHNVEFGVSKICLQYCEDNTLTAYGWHQHIPDEIYIANGQPVPTMEERTRFGSLPPRQNPSAPFTYDDKPMICLAFKSITELTKPLATSNIRYSLPTEAQWEKAARGGLIGCRHAWGDEPASPSNCDFGRFHDFSIQRMKTFAPNGYGLYAMNGCVWEWTRDWYDRDYYRHSAEVDPKGPSKEQGKEKVLRGGSWADCADVQTVTYRMSHDPRYNGSPNIGFRLCRTRV